MKNFSQTFQKASDFWVTIQVVIKIGSEYLRPWIATPPQAVDFVDCDRTATEHHGNPTLRASGLDESQKSATPQAAGNGPAAIQPSSFCFLPFHPWN